METERTEGEARVDGGAPPELIAGARLGEWELEAPLGAGGYATVWRARHHVLADRRVAIKVPHDAGYAALLRDEGLLQHRVEGEHVVRIQGLDPDHDPPYLVLDLIEGGTLRDRLRAGALEPVEAVRILLQVARGLAAAHGQGVIHRDLKPENVLLDPGGTAYVSDFGLGLAVERATSDLLASGSLRTASGHDLAGTLRYMAPEQRDPEAEVDARADLFALGVILFEALTGEAPCGVELPSDVVPGLDPRLDDLYRRLCARLPARLPDVNQLVSELEAIAADPAAAPPDPARTGAARSVEVPAGLTWRAVAGLVDFVPFVILSVGALRLTPPLGLVGGFLAFVIYDVVAVALTGRTLGKWACGLRVASAGGGALDPAQGLQREAFRLVSLLTLGLGYLPALVPGGRALHDRVAGTEVVHDGPAPVAPDR